MKEYAIFGIVIALLAGVFFDTVYGEVSKAITRISTAIERGGAA